MYIKGDVQMRWEQYKKRIGGIGAVALSLIFLLGMTGCETGNIEPVVQQQEVLKSAENCKFAELRYLLYDR